PVGMGFDLGDLLRQTPKIGREQRRGDPYRFHRHESTDLLRLRPGSVQPGRDRPRSQSAPPIARLPGGWIETIARAPSANPTTGTPSTLAHCPDASTTSAGVAARTL